MWVILKFPHSQTNQNWIFHWSHRLELKTQPTARRPERNIDPLDLLCHYDVRLGFQERFVHTNYLRIRRRLRLPVFHLRPRLHLRGCVTGRCLLFLLRLSLLVLRFRLRLPPRPPDPQPSWQQLSGCLGEPWRAQLFWQCFGNEDSLLALNGQILFRAFQSIFTAN